MYSVSRRELAKRAWRSGATVLDVSRCLTSAAVTPLSNALNGVDKVCVSSFINTGVGRFFVICYFFVIFGCSKKFCSTYFFQLGTAVDTLNLILGFMSSPNEGD